MKQLTFFIIVISKKNLTTDQYCSLHYQAMCVCLSGPREYNHGMTQPSARNLRLSLNLLYVVASRSYILRTHMNNCTLFFNK
jgi:hypothetical protein